MPHQKGATASMMLGIENSAFNTISDTGFVLPVNYGESLKGEQNINAANTIRGNRNPEVGFRGYRQVGGAVPVPVDSVALIYWLIATFGDPTSTGADPYVHEFKIANTQPSFSIEKAFTDLTTDRYHQFTGCKMDGFSIDAGGDGELVINFNVFGAEDGWDTSAFDGSPTSPSISRINNFDGAVAEGGGASTIITAASINVSEMLDKSDSLIPIAAAGVRGSIPESSLKIDGNITFLFDDDGYTLLQKGDNATESGLKLTWTASASSIFELELQEIEYGRTGPEVPTPGGILITMPFTAHYADGAEASAIVARVTNATASYDVVT